MLNAIEVKLTAILGDGLAARTHLQVLEGGAAPPAAGRGLVQVSISGIQAGDYFSPDQFSSSDVNVRRILPLSFHAQIDFSAQPQDATPQAAVAARVRMLEDLSLAAHLLSDDSIRDGTGFVTN